MAAEEAAASLEALQQKMDETKRRRRTQEKIKREKMDGRECGWF